MKNVFKNVTGLTSVNVERMGDGERHGRLRGGG